MAKDPVCGMEVDQTTSQWQSEHEGTRYYFCVQGCQRIFDAYPEKFVEFKEQQSDQENQPHN